MRIDIITIFPEVIRPYFEHSILKIAQRKKKLKVYVHNLRDYTLDKHRKVDDRPFGGGAGMVLSADPFFRAVGDIKRSTKGEGRGTKVILLSPRGKPLSHKLTVRFARYKQLILLCGHYEGVDERVSKHLVDDEVSIGDYILTGGELAALTLADAVVRLIPGVLGHKDSNKDESFKAGLLEYPQYTRPADYKGYRVPEVLLSGNHKMIKEWRGNQAVSITKKRRPDLVNFGTN